MGEENGEKGGPLRRRGAILLTSLTVSLIATALISLVILLPKVADSAESGGAATASEAATAAEAAATSESAAESTSDSTQLDGELLPATADEPTITSTPRELWALGVMPYLYQTDPQWADVEYSGSTLSTAGCGPTALCMVYIYLTGDTSIDPAQMAAFSTENGYSTDGSGTAWALMTEGAAKLGLSSTTLSASASSLQASLEAGHPVICVMAPGAFTDVGHFIVLERMTSDGKVVVHDSNSVGRSMRTWDLELIVSEAKNIWSFWVE